MYYLWHFQFSVSLSKNRPKLRHAAINLSQSQSPLHGSNDWKMLVMLTRTNDSIAPTKLPICVHAPTHTRLLPPWSRNSVVIFSRMNDTRPVTSVQLTTCNYSVNICTFSKYSHHHRHRAHKQKRAKITTLQLTVKTSPMIIPLNGGEGDATAVNKQ